MALFGCVALIWKMLPLASCSYMYSCTELEKAIVHPNNVEGGVDNATSEGSVPRHWPVRGVWLPTAVSHFTYTPPPHSPSPMRQRRANRTTSPGPMTACATTPRLQAAELTPTTMYPCYWPICSFLYLWHVSLARARVFHCSPVDASILFPSFTSPRCWASIAARKVSSHLLPI